MRTTITLSGDVAAAVEKARSERGTGISETVNDLIRKGLASGDKRPKFRQRSQPVGLEIDISNVAEAIENLDGPRAR